MKDQYQKAFSAAASKDFSSFRESIWNTLNQKSADRYAIEKTFMANMVISQELSPVKEETTNPSNPAMKRTQASATSENDEANESKKNYKDSLSSRLEIDADGSRKIVKKEIVKLK